MSWNEYWNKYKKDILDNKIKNNFEDNITKWIVTGGLLLIGVLLIVNSLYIVQADWVRIIIFVTIIASILYSFDFKYLMRMR